MFDVHPGFEPSRCDLWRRPHRSFAKAGLAFRPRIHARSEETGANDVPADRAFLVRERFGSRANSSNGRDSQLFAEFRSAKIRAQLATSSGKESLRQKAFVA